jgi:Tfp pilus assembly protein PilF
MGQVFEALDLELHQTVALKTIRPDLTLSESTLTRFKREVQLGREVNHPNLCRIFDIGFHHGEPGEEFFFLTMEFLRGVPLSTVAGNQPMAPAEAVPLILQMASGLAALHRAGIVHRDFKPGNVMLAEARGESGRRAIITDFGLALEAGSERTKITEQHRILGTPGYMAPEQLLGFPPTPSVDVFALGVVMYEMLTGRAPFREASDARTALPPSTYASGLNPRWDRLILSCLDSDPARRPPDANAVLALLEQRQPRSPFRARPRMFAASALLVLLALSIYLLPLVLRHHPPEAALGHYSRGVTLLAEGADEAALNELGATTELDPQFVMAHVRRAEAAFQLEDFDEARSELLEFPSGFSLYLLSAPDRTRLGAVRALVRRSFPEAIREYRALVGSLPRERQPEALVSLANAEIQVPDVPAALAACQLARTIDADYAPAILLSAMLHARARQNSLAAPEFERAIALQRNASNVPGLIQALQQYAQMLSASVSPSDLGRARTLLQDALSFSRTLDDGYLEVQSLVLMSELSLAHGDPQQGEQIARQALDLARQSNNPALVAQCQVKLGRALLFGAKVDDARKAFEAALAIPARHAVPRERARAAAELAQLDIKLQKPAQAVPLLDSAIDYFTKAGSLHEEARSLILLGTAQEQAGHAADSMQAFRKGLDLSLRTNDTDYASWAEESMADSLMRDEVYPDALKHLEADSRLLAPTADERLIAYNKFGRADALWRSGDFGPAKILMAELGHSTAAAHDPELAFNIDASAAEMALAENDAASANRYLKLASAVPLPARPQVAVYLELIDCPANRRLAACEQALHSAEQLSDSALTRSARLILARTDLAAGNAAAAREQAREVLTGLPPEGLELTRLLAAAVAGDAKAVRQTLARIHARWGETAYQKLVSRPDVHRFSALFS